MFVVVFACCGVGDNAIGRYGTPWHETQFPAIVTKLCPRQQPASYYICSLLSISISSKMRWSFIAHFMHCISAAKATCSQNFIFLRTLPVIISCLHPGTRVSAPRNQDAAARFFPEPGSKLIAGGKRRGSWQGCMELLILT